MSEAPPVYTGPAFVGWRAWRILAHSSLGKPSSCRLAACGLNGLPKLWEPRQAQRAVCGKFETTHDAPWPECHCGVHAYADRVDAEEHFATFLDSTNGAGALGWAFGRVSLWGRIVEHEIGWRAEYAYPYELTVYGSDELAARVRDLYLVDVETGILPPIEPENDVEDVVAELEVLQGETVALQTRIAALRAKRAAATAEPASASGIPGEWWRDEAARCSIDSDQRIAWELHRFLREHGTSVVSTTDLRAAILALPGVPKQGCSSFAIVNHLGSLALRHDVRRFRGRGKTFWADKYCWWRQDAIPADLVEDDISLEHLDRDVPLVRAIGAASRDWRGATRKEVAEQLGHEGRFFGLAYARCVSREWITSPETDFVRLTDLGTAVARFGSEPPRLPRERVEYGPVLLSTLAVAYGECGGPVTSREIASRFYKVEAQTIGQRMRKLAERGQVVGARTADGPLMHWSPALPETAAAELAEARLFVSNIDGGE